VFAALIVGVVVFVVALGALLVDQVGGLVDAIPDYARQISDFLNDTLATELSGDKLAANLLGNPGAQDFVNGLAAAAVGLSTTLVGLILQGLTIGLFTFYQPLTGEGEVARLGPERPRGHDLVVDVQLGRAVVSWRSPSRSLTNSTPRTRLPTCSSRSAMSCCSGGMPMKL
jgi:hypothetical protein